MPGDEDDWFDSECRRRLETLRKDDFEAFFTQMMRDTHGDAYQDPTPHGSDGDYGSDGYLLTANHCYQCYAPDRFRVPATREKMTKNLGQAVSNWQHMTDWTFVLNHGSRPAPLVKELANLQAAHPDFKLNLWTRDDVVQQFLKLPATVKERLLGKERPFSHVEYLTRQTIAAVVKRVAPSASALDHPTNPTPGKLQHNNVNANWTMQLKVGMAGHPQVRGFFQDASDEQLGTRVGNSLHTAYDELKAAGLDANECLENLYARLFDASDAQHAQHHAVLAVLAYFFEACDVLEPEP